MSRYSVLPVCKTVHQQVMLHIAAETSQHLLHMIDFSILSVCYINLLQHQVLFGQMMSITLNNHPQVQFQLDVTAFQKILHTYFMLQCHNNERPKLNFTKCCFRQRQLIFLGPLFLKRNWNLLPWPHPTTNKKNYILRSHILEFYQSYLICFNIFYCWDNYFKKPSAFLWIDEIQTSFSMIQDFIVNRQTIVVWFFLTCNYDNGW